MWGCTPTQKMERLRRTTSLCTIHLAAPRLGTCRKTAPQRPYLNLSNDSIANDLLCKVAYSIRCLQRRAASGSACPQNRNPNPMLEIQGLPMSAPRSCGLSHTKSVNGIDDIVPIRPGCISSNLAAIASPVLGRKRQETCEPLCRKNGCSLAVPDVV